MTTREMVVNQFLRQVKLGNHIIGVASGAGITAKYAEQGGADFLLALNAGKFRQMGRSSAAGFLPFCNSNEMVMTFASREIKPVIQKIPVFFGLNATDPTIDLDRYIENIKQLGFEGINNFPTVGLIDGQYREALEETGFSYDLEVEAIRIAHEKDLFTVAFVFDEEQAKSMLHAGADIICAHLGFTAGGMLGAKKVLSLEAAKLKVQRIFDVCDAIRPDVIKMIYGGPVKMPVDVQYMYSNTNLMGYIGGSSFERIPSEKTITNITRAFKTTGNLSESDLMVKMLEGITKHYDYVQFVKKYVAEHYMQKISFIDLAHVAYISRSHLSALFKREVGCSFPVYLVKFRMNRAKEIISAEDDLKLSEVAELVGYSDYAQFSKMFKKYVGLTPTQFKSRHKHEC
ncbi:phosphoenolpyruvate hydrolase family protein [Fusibacter ferrireducens]|uniref:Phosphoenolpyruvate hydrolase family protein n=1 Tax=Fusibacter ferrireducens TaxID=2785058 RepID=A0ABR9ZTZ4_9FIRM|nr:phosphoenolpyruvate hydrolase family protein [Fusibacter ferrireducens]MBF4693917.1 phosphoenolpyruvate hydrolase family protein [Fusibacter ferrireducens]